MAELILDETMPWLGFVSMLCVEFKKALQATSVP